MSMGEAGQDMSEQTDDESIVAYLRAHPDFFERHPQLVEKLSLPHEAGGQSISLVERQVAVLRAKNRELEERLRELVDVARSNDTLAHRIHRLAIRLLAATDPAAVLETLEACLREDFGANQTVVVLFHSSSEIVEDPDTRFLRHMDRNNPALKSFKTFVEAGVPRCGRIRDAQKEFLFPGDGAVIASVALVPLGQACATGMMAIGSRDPERFNPTMSTDFLGRIGELTAAAVTAARDKAGRSC